MEKSIPWGKIAIKSDSAYNVCVNDVYLTFLTFKDVCTFSLQTEDNVLESSENRVVGGVQDVFLLPALPDRTLILKPKTNLSVLPGVRYKFYVYLPVTFQIFAGGVRPEQKIFEYEPKSLSSTWFGEPHDGELSYALYSSFDTDINDAKAGMRYAVCPIEVFNSSKEVLEIKRLAVRGIHLNIFTDGVMLITNKVRIKYLGINTLSNVEFSKTITRTIPNLKQVASARVPEDKTILKRSFQLFRHLTQF